MIVGSNRDRYWDLLFCTRTDGASTDATSDIEYRLFHLGCCTLSQTLKLHLFLARTFIYSEITSWVSLELTTVQRLKITVYKILSFKHCCNKTCMT